MNMRFPDEYAISWKRLAEPQTDQYDTKVVLASMRRYGYVRGHKTGGRSFFDGQVAIVRESGQAFPDHYAPAAQDHPNLERAAGLVGLWPTVFAQLQSLIESVSPWIDTTRQPNQRKCNRMSRSMGFGKIAATVNDPVELAETLVSEMAHQKLYALGVEQEAAERIISNSKELKVDEDSKDHERLQSTPAVLHEQYSLAHAAALHVKIAEAEAIPEQDRHYARVLLSDFLPKLQRGYDILRAHAEFDNAGANFMDGYSDWLDRILSSADATIEKHQARHQRTHLTSRPRITTAEIDTPDHDSVNESRTGPDDVLLGDNNARFHKLDDIQEHVLLDEMMLYVPSRDQVFSLNGSARMIWELCDGGRNIREISREVARDLGNVDSETMEALVSDVKAGILELQRLGLVRTT